MNSKSHPRSGQEKSRNHMPHDRVIALGGLLIVAGLSPLRCNGTGEPPPWHKEEAGMTDVVPATLMLAMTLGIWAGIAWLLIERIG